MVETEPLTREKYLELCAEGWSRRSIQHEYSLSKNQLAGRIHRWGLCDSGFNEKRSAKKAARERERQRRTKKRKSLRAATRAKTDDIERRKEKKFKPAVIPPIRKVGNGIINLNTCQYIQGEPTHDDSCKCGEPVILNSVYCAEHHARCWWMTRRAA